MRTFEDYLVDEGFFDSLKSGFQQSYSSAKNSPETSNSNFEKYASIVLPALNKAKNTANQYSQKLGIDPVLAASLVTSGLIGGPAVVPMAAILYFARKPINKAASDGFDKVANKMGWAGQQQPGQQQPGQQQPGQQQPGQQQPGQQPGQQQPAIWTPDQVKKNPNAKLWIPGQMQNSWNLNFADYSNSRDLNEGWFGDKIAQGGNWLGKKLGGAEDYVNKQASNAKQWWNEKGADQVGGAIGKAAGYVSGKTTKHGQKIGGMISSSFSSLRQFASENKLAIGKAAFLFAIGVAVGAGVGAATNMISGALDGMMQSGVVPEAEITTLKQSLGSEITSSQVTSDDAKDFVGQSQEQQPVQQPGQQPGQQPVQQPGQRFWGSHIGEPVAGLQEPGVDTSGELPKGRLHGKPIWHEPGTQVGSWNDKLGNFTTSSGPNGETIYHSEDGKQYVKHDSNLGSLQRYREYDPSTGKMGRPSAITNYMKSGKGGWTSTN